MPEMELRIVTYNEFWRHYLNVHTDPRTRLLHFVGTALAIVSLVLAAATPFWWFVALAPIFGFGFAWTGHFLVEKNEPAAFSRPLWSVASDFRMFFLWCTGRLESELRKAGVAT